MQHSNLNHFTYLCLQWLCTIIAWFQQQQIKLKSNQSIQKRWNKIHLNSRKWFLPLHNNWSNSMLESGPIFECCKCGFWYLHAMHSSKTTFQVKENDGNTCKKIEHLCALRSRINTYQQYPMDRWHQERKHRLQRFQPAFLRTLLKNGKLARVLWTYSWQDCPGSGCETAWFVLALDYTEFYMKFYLNFTITKFYVPLTDQAKHIHYHCPFKTQWQGRWWRWWIQTKAATLSKVQTSWDQVYIYTPTLSLACYICPSISHLLPNTSHLLCVYYTFFLLYRQENDICDPRRVGSVKQCYITQKSAI